MHLPASKPGDLFLLFHRLPFDFSAALPLPLGPGVCLETTPQGLLDSAEKGLADYLLPGYNLPGIGLNNCCLRCYVESIPLTTLTSKDLLFLSVIALRLHDPVGISIGGHFRLGKADNPLLDPTLYQLSSTGPMKRLPYTPKALEAAATVTERLVSVEQQGFTRLRTALIFFSHVTVGVCASFQLSYLGLFAALEALFVPSGNKGLILSGRVSRFLENFQFPVPMEAWIKNEYINGRHKLAHGVHDATFGATLNPSRHEAFVRLHEITRLCLLGFLALDDQVLKQLSEDSGITLQHAISTLGAAKGQYLEGQQMWIG